MGSENDIESFIQLQKQKLAQERQTLHQTSDYGQDNTRNQVFSNQPHGAGESETQRRQWQHPSQLEINGKEPAGLRFGAYDEKRKRLDEERKKEYNERTQSQLPTKPTPRNLNGTEDDEGGMFSKLGQYEARRKVLDVERHNEYNNKLSQADYRRTGRQTTPAGPSLPGLRDHPSANQLKMKQRNAEYNEFLQAQQQKQNNRFADKKGHAVQPVPQPEPSRQGQQRQATQRQTNVIGQTTPRQSYGAPSYEELLDEKRRQEQSYRRRNDLETVQSDTRRNYPPVGTFPEDDRFDDLDRQYQKRKVKFANDRASEPEGADIYDWEYSKQGRSRSFYREPEPRSVDPYERARSVPPKEEMTGLAIGHAETASAARRRKEQYRQDLEHQMTSRHKPVNSGSYSRENDYPPRLPASQNAFQPKPTYSDQAGPILDDRRPLASILNERRDLVDTSPRGNAVRLGLGPGLLETGFTGLYEPSVLSQRSQPTGYGGQQPFQTPSDAAYNYYGAHDPLANFTAPPLGPPQHPTQPQRQPAQYQPPQQPAQYQPPQQPFFGEPQRDVNQPTAAVGAFPSERTDRGQQKKDSQQTYQQELRRQMEERQRMQAAKKAEQEAYDRKLNAEIANYNPFGRGGAGAPMKDSTGNVVADLRVMKNANTGLTPRLEAQQGPAQPTVSAAPPMAGTTPRFDPTLPSANLNFSDVADATGHARGGHGIFGEPKTEVQKTATDKYKEELQQQIDEKKRVVDLEKQKLREEEEREMKRLEEDRIKIQKEYEAEQTKAKAKEEETRRKNAEMKEAAEEKKRLDEQQKEAADEKRQQKEAEAAQQREKDEEERRQRETKKTENRPESPPIPTLRSKTQPPGSMDLRENSPPIPTQRSKTQHDEALTNSQPLIRDAEPATSRAPVRPPSNTRAESRAQSAEVLNQLAHMRQQLQQERQRVENALTKQKLDVDVYDPRTKYTGQDPTDVFETARNRKPVSARRTRSDSEDTQQPLPKPQTATSLLQSDSAFIDDSGMRAAFPDDFDNLATNQNARRRRRERLQPAYPERDTESVHSIDPDRITRKNQDRLKKLKAIAGDEISLDDPDDIIDRFMTKQSHNRPPSGQTLTDESWINTNR